MQRIPKLIPALLLGLAVLATVPAEVAAQGNQALVERVRFCTSEVFCFGHTQSEYQAWEHNNVAHEKQQRTLISRYVEPPRASVEHLVFLSAGQRQILSNGRDNLLTGQPNQFELGFRLRDEERWMNIDEDSIAFRIFDEGIRSPVDTFAALAFDARFHHDFTLSNKDEIAEAYYDWLRTKFLTANLKSVYLAGHSRGGALVLYLAEKFRRDFPEVPLIVHLFDPVLNRRQGELGVQDNLLVNPLQTGFASFELDFQQFFSNQNRLLVYNIVSGEAVEAIVPLARSAAHRTGAGQAAFFDLGWFLQQYTTLGHTGVARNTGWVNAALNHLEIRGDLLIQDYCDSRPPQVSCNVSPHFSFADFTTATFDAFGSTSQSGAPITSYSWQFHGSSIQVGTPPSGTGAGPHHVTFWRVGGFSDLTGTVTVTDGNGNSASRSCTTFVQAPGSGCDDEFSPCLE